MSNSLWEIDNKLQSIIEQIEDAGGEFTEEQEQELQLTQEEFNEKIDSYCAVIDKYKSYVDACKAEKKRVNEVQKVRENIVEKLKNLILDSVIKYGITGKNGNKVFETATRKLFTKSLDKLNIDEQRLAILSYNYINYINELYENGVLDSNDSDVLNAITDAINAIVKSENGDTFEDFNTNDIKAIKYNISIDIEASELLNHPELFSLIRNDAISSVKLTKSVDKDQVRFLNGIEQENENPKLITIAKFIKENSLTIK